MGFGIGAQELLILLAGAGCIGGVVIGIVVLVVGLGGNRNKPRDE